MRRYKDRNKNFGRKERDLEREERNRIPLQTERTMRTRMNKAKMDRPIPSLDSQENAEYADIVVKL